MATLDVFRSTVGAAALGIARRAFDETTGRVSSRRLFGAPMAELQLVQAKVAEMAMGIDAGALLVYRAAWTKDTRPGRVTREAAMAKLHATETAQEVIDGAVQLFGGLGVTVGQTVERLYREVRALRIYEGASEVQKLIIARAALAADRGGHRVTETAHIDTFARDHLPPREQWPDLLFTLPELELPRAAERGRRAAGRAIRRAPVHPRRRGDLDLRRAARPGRAHRRRARRRHGAGARQPGPAARAQHARAGRLLVRDPPGRRRRGGDDAAAARE